MAPFASQRRSHVIKNIKTASANNSARRTPAISRSDAIVATFTSRLDAQFGNLRRGSISPRNEHGTS
jgi:hypothetical protein